MRDTYRVAVRVLLELDGMRQAQLLAGAAGRDRTVTGVAIADAPDFLDHTEPHTFVLTSGYPLMHFGPEGQSGAPDLVRFLRMMDERKVAGLGITMGRYISDLPPEVLQAANELGVPIVALPADTHLDSLMAHAHAGLAEIQMGVLRRTDQLHAALEGLVLEGADMQRIAGQIAEVLGLGILVTSVDGREMASALTENMRHRLRGAELFDETGRFRIERVRLQPIFIESGQVLVEPIVAGSSDLARMVAFDPRKAISKDDLYALQRASTVAALLITQQQALNAVENKYRGDFLRDVLSGRSQNREYCEDYAIGLGWRLDMPAIVVSAQLDPQDPRERQASTRVRRSWQARFHVAWTQCVGRESKLYPCADFSDEVVSILSLPDANPDEPAKAIRDLQRMVERVVKNVSGDRGGGRRPFSVGTSRLVTAFDQLPTAYQQARRATEVGRRFTGGSSTSHFDDLGIHRLIGLIPDREEMTAFAEDMLGELADDTAAAEELRQTLQVLLDHNLNVAEASRVLLMHYNTMRYRISKLEKILGPFTTDANLRLNIAVALQVRKIQV